MDNLWVRINDLVPEPQCRTRGDKILEWTDKRKKPSTAQLKAVDVDLIEVKKRFSITVQNYLEQGAIERGYDSLLSAISYADEPEVPDFQIEGQKFRKWRSFVWETFFTLLEDGSTKTLTAEGLIKKLPVME